MGDKVVGGTGNVGHLFECSTITEVCSDLGQAIPDVHSIGSLTVHNGKVYGGTADYNYEAHFFDYDPNTGSVTDWGVVLPGEYEYYVNALTAGNDGKVYGGTGWDGHLFTCDPGTGQCSDRGTAAPGWDIYALATAPDGKIYGGSMGGYLFAYDPVTDTFADLGQPVQGEWYVYSLVFGPDGKLYGGTAHLNGHLFVYDPGTGITTDKGRALWGNNYVYTLARGLDGKIYGGGLQLFTYDPADHPNGSPGTAVSTDIIPSMQSLADVAYASSIYALTQGTDGRIYGGGSGGRLFAYDPSTGTVTDLGQAVPDNWNIYSLTTGTDGKIYGGTYDYYDYSGHLFVYDPIAQAFTNLGEPVAGEPVVWALTTGTNGMIYGGTYGYDDWSGHFFIYDPATGTLTDKGQAVYGEIAVYALTTGMGGKIYGGTAWHGHLFAYDPASGVLTDLGTGAPGTWEIYDLVTASDGVIYGANWDGYLFAYNPFTGLFTNLGQPVTSGYDNRALACVDGRVYGISHSYNYGRRSAKLFEYDTASGMFRVLGNPMAGEYYVYSLASGNDGLIYGGTGYLYGHLFSYDPDYVFEWGTASYSADTPWNTAFTVDVLSADEAVLLEDISPGQSLGSIDPALYPGIKLRAQLSTSDGDLTPSLMEWAVAWPTVQAVPSSLAYMLAPGEPDVAWRTVQIDSAGDDVINWSASDNRPWLNCSPTSGTLPATLTVTVDKSGLAQDTWYTGRVTVDWSYEYASGTMEITVSLFVGEHWNTFLPLVTRSQ